jgi:hypothetical protein
VASMEAKLHASEEYIATLEHSLSEEASRHAPLYGSGLESLTSEQLDALRAIHSDGLRAVAALQLARQHEEQAAAAAAAAASAVVALGVVDGLDLDDDTQDHHHGGLHTRAATHHGSGATSSVPSLGPGVMSALGGYVNGFVGGGGGHTSLWGAAPPPPSDGSGAATGAGNTQPGSLQPLGLPQWR